MYEKTFPNKRFKHTLDFLQKQIRFVINYNLLSLDYNNRIFIQVKINEKLALPSVVSLFASSNWLEREVLDMFGISFKFNLDLRRILTDYGFDFYPFSHTSKKILRKNKRSSCGEFC